MKKGEIMSLEMKQRISIKKKGSIPWNKGIKCKKLSKEHKRKISEAISGEKHYFFGKKHPEETKKKISLANKGKIGWNKGIPTSLETRQKISLARKGKRYPNLSLALKGRISSMKGRNHSEETRRKLSESHKGEKSSLWKGGVSPKNMLIRESFEYRSCREAVFKRDNWTCVWCGQRGGKLNADHIKPFALFPELHFAIDNIRTLCISCHRKTDTYGGRIKNYKLVTS